MYCNDGNPTYIYRSEEGLSFEGESLASSSDYEEARNNKDALLDELREEENIKLGDGYFIVDEEKNLIQDWGIY